MSKNITVAYNPNDFFYVNAITSAGSKSSTIDADFCPSKKEVNITRAECLKKNDKDDDINTCYDKELCINIDNAKKIYELENRHDGTGEKYNNVNAEYRHEIVKSYNLGIGVLVIGYLCTIFYRQ